MPYATGAYTSVPGDEDETRVCAAYPQATYARLPRSSAATTPITDNLFRLNQNIRPC